MPAVLFTTEAGTEVDAITITPPVSLALTIDPDYEGNAITEFEPGGIYGTTVSGLPADSDYAVVYSISGNTSSRTYITPTGNIHVGPDEETESLTITARAVVADSVTITENVAVEPATIIWPRKTVADGPVAP